MTSKGKQGRPEGLLVTVPQDQRAKMRARREEMEMRQEDVADIIGVTPATISNVESGKQEQMNPEPYAKWLQLLFGKSLAGEEERTALIERILCAPLDVVPSIIKLVDVVLPPEPAPDVEEGGNDKARLGGDRTRTSRSEK